MDNTAQRDLDVLVGKCRDIVDKYATSSPDVVGELIEAIAERSAVDADGKAVLPDTLVATGTGERFLVLDISLYGQVLLDDAKWHDLSDEGLFVAPLSGVTADGCSFRLGDVVYYKNDKHVVKEYVGEGIWKLDDEDGTEVHQDRLWHKPTCVSADGHAIIEGDIVYCGLVAVYVCDVNLDTRMVQCCTREKPDTRSWLWASSLYYYPRKGVNEMLGLAANLERKYADDPSVSELVAYLRRLIDEGKAA